MALSPLTNTPGASSHDKGQPPVRASQRRGSSLKSPTLPFFKWEWILAAHVCLPPPTRCVGHTEGCARWNRHPWGPKLLDLSSPNER